MGLRKSRNEGKEETARRRPSEKKMNIKRATGTNLSLAIIDRLDF